MDSKAYDIRESMEYQLGYKEGYLQGRQDFYEQIAKDLEMAKLQRPIQICLQKENFCFLLK